MTASFEGRAWRNVGAGLNRPDPGALVTYTRVLRKKFPEILPDSSKKSRPALHRAVRGVLEAEVVSIAYGLNFMKTADKGGKVMGKEWSRPL